MNARRNRLTAACVQWLASPRLNMFVTVTLKQRITSIHGSVALTTDEVIRTARLIRDRTGKKLCRRPKPGAQLLFIPFIHNSPNERLHLHILAERPDGIDPIYFEGSFKNAIKKLDWPYNEVDVREMNEAPISGQRLIQYGLDGQEDLIGFLPEACSIY